MPAIIKSCRYTDTRTLIKHVLLKITGDILYFSDGFEIGIKEFNEYFEIVNANG